MASGIDSTKPVAGSPTTESVRDNFAAAKNESNAALRSSLDFAAAAGTVDVLTADFSYNVVKAAGVRITIKASGANTGACTLNVDSAGANPIVTVSNAALVAGNIAGVNHYLDLMWSATLSSWILMNPVLIESGVIGASRTISLTGDVTGSVSFNGSADVTTAAVLESQGLLKVYPVGSIYLSVLAANPSTLFGGTWVAFGTGKMLVGIDSADTDFDTLEETGGAKSAAASITTPRDGWGAVQSSGKLPEPTTSGRLVTGSGLEENNENLESLAHASADRTTSVTLATVSPYVVISMWKRTA
jgi:hypothetical protein|tara:strand:- start:1829 stop:2734 length:906 start_codon:yes stop_codon:yes gene_type:complete